MLYLTPSPAAAQGWDPFAPSERPPPRDSGVEREELPSSAFEGPARGVEREELDPVMAADGSGLPHELWSGLSAEQFAKSIAALELPPKSPALHALWRRLIASDTTAADGTTNVRFTALRVEALDQTGLIDEVADTLAKDSASASDPLLQALTARSEIGLGNTERGCEIGKSLLAAQSGLPKPIQADIMLINGYCAAARGDMESASLQAGLLRELDLGLVGADFLDAVTSGITPSIPKDTKLTLLDYRIAAIKGGLDREKLMAAATPALLAGLARDPRGAPDVRLAAGEAAVKLNALPAQDLGPLYQAEGAGGDAATIERSGLFKSAEGEQTPLKKARLIRAFLDDARPANLYWPALQLMAGPLRNLEPIPEIGWFAETAIEINLAAGNYEGVRTWARLGESLGASNGAGPPPLAHWAALADIVDPSAGPDRGRNLAAIESMAANGRFDPALLHRLVTVLDALDMNVPMPLWDVASRSPQPAGGHLPDTGVLSELADASKKKQFGRTVLLVMRTIGSRGAEGAHMIALGDSLRALKRAGLDTEARQLALEGLFGAWPRSVSQ
ncbi:MAG TPA: hypothetical protein VEA77_05245 [Hyphomicrobium sp.]|nr:hypothetical protein [Hyphomicrobium sp.]